MCIRDRCYRDQSGNKHCPINVFKEEKNFNTCISEIQKYGRTGLEHGCRIQVTNKKISIEEIRMNEYVVHLTQNIATEINCHGKKTTAFLRSGSTEIRIEEGCYQTIESNVLVYSPDITPTLITRIPFQNYQATTEKFTTDGWEIANLAVTAILMIIVITQGAKNMVKQLKKRKMKEKCPVEPTTPTQSQKEPKIIQKVQNKEK